MKKGSLIIKDVLISVLVMISSFIWCLVIQKHFRDNTLISAVFVFGVFLVSVLTKGFLYGVISAILSVFAVNFAFTFPYFAFDFSVMENIFSSIILLAVAVVTCGLTTTIKRQEAIKAEGEMEKMRANLLRAVSHDLRTPLTTIYGTSSALLDNYWKFSDEQKQAMLVGIKEDAEWLNRMVENLLSITRLDSSKVCLVKNETVLDELIDSILIKFAKRFPSQPVEVSIPDEFVTIPMDAILIEQVVINILENAAEHAKGMTKLQLSVHIESGKAVFEIQDNGCGIDPEKLKNIFSGQLYKDKMPSDSAKNNAGIGLSVCASIIKAHSGEIKAINLKEGGCKFVFTLKLEDGDGE
jgi:two-component system sensor histidine kinase KdpD